MKATDRPARVLIVEDIPEQARDMKEELEAAGFDVPEFAMDAAAALEAAGKLHPDVALVDIHLKNDDDGIMLADELQQRYGIRTVFVTCDETATTFRRALETNPKDYLIKPVDPQQLSEAIKWALLDLGHLPSEIRELIPDADVWLKTPNENLGGVAPCDIIGTRREIELRRLLRAGVQGLPS